MGTGLTDAEKAVLDHLGAAWSAWVELPDQHPDDVPEFRTAIHALQNMVAFRVARRVNPEAWWQPGETSEDVPVEKIWPREG